MSPHGTPATDLFPAFAGLKAFYAVGRASGVARAAERLGISRSAVSHQLKNLEAELDVRLYERRGGKLRLTAEGEAYLGEIEEPMRRILEATERVRAKPRCSRVTVTMNPSFAASWFLPRMRRMTEALPELELNVVATTRVLDLGAERVDLAIRRGTGSWPGLECAPLLEERIVPLVAPALLEETGTHCLVDLAKRSRLLVNARLPTEWDEWARAFDLELDRRVPRFVLATYELAMKACLDGLGLALGRRPFVDPLLEAGELVELSGSPGELEVGHFLAWRRDAELSVMARKLRAWLLEDGALK